MKEKNIALSIILTIVTCGIYGIYWFITLTDEVKQESANAEAPSGGMAFLLTLVTCGIYGFYWAYKMGENLALANANNGIQAENKSVMYLVLQILGLGIVGYAFMQSDLNAIYRKKAGVPQA